MSILTDTLIERVAGIITTYSMLSSGDRLGVAVSGGADSVVLLHLLYRLFRSLEIELTILHLNHRLRGDESDSDEAFVRALAESLGIQIVIGQTELESGNPEQAARQARREFFKQSMQQHRLRRVALGHTRSDQAETVLFRFLRGSGLTGLAGMRMVTEDGLIRPLLTTSREEVRGWAVSEGITWREDSSNQNIHFTRNRLRHITIPALTGDFNRNLEEVLARTAELARSEEDYWYQRIEHLYGEITKRSHLGSIFHIPSLAALPLAVQRRLIRRALVDVRGDLRSLNMEHIEAILALCPGPHGHARVIVPGIDAIRSFEKLLLTRPGELNSEKRHYHLELKVGEELKLPYRAGWIYAHWAAPRDRFCANFKEEQELGPLYVRNWEPGDELKRPGHQKADKLKSLFQDQRVVLWERRHWPVVVQGDEIVWARQFGSSAKFIDSGESCRSIRLSYRPAEDGENQPAVNRKLAD